MLNKEEKIENLSELSKKKYEEMSKEELLRLINIMNDYIHDLENGNVDLEVIKQINDRYESMNKTKGVWLDIC